MLLLAALSSCASERAAEPAKSISGIYPALAFYNEEGECGTGAVVPWNGSLWAMTYGPHMAFGSTDMLYQITPDKELIIRSESIGGTHANRLIHKESGQLNIGPYFIDSLSNVRAVPWEQAPGRYTGAARHLTEPESKIYIATMEEGFYEVDVNTLKVNELYADGNAARRRYSQDPKNNPPYRDLLPGAHGKGLYSGQGVLIYSDNGELSDAAMKYFDATSGSLSEWDGKDWKVIRRNQFTEITSRGGICGSENPATDPIWAIGWDHKSVLLGVRELGRGWTFYRLPKASHSYDGAHGWNTEWPRIREIGEKDYLMTMHGLFWNFPADFNSSASAGIRPRSAYLKVIGDFTRWGDELVFGCDDSAQKEFLNKRKVKGRIEGPGQSNSNLWFTSLGKPDELGPATVDGLVWKDEDVKAGVASDPYLFAGWKVRQCWLQNNGNKVLTLSLEVDEKGDGHFCNLHNVILEAGESSIVTFAAEEQGEWIRVVADKDGKATVAFTYTVPDTRGSRCSDIFDGLAASGERTLKEGLLYGLGDNRKSLGLLAATVKNGKVSETGYYEMGDKLELVHKKDTATADFIREKFAIPHDVVNIEAGSVLIVDDSGRRWRLPLGKEVYKNLTKQAQLRICREVATERDLLSCMGTFYELPAENADGFAKIRPIASHDYRINDYASYRGMLVMTGVKAHKNNPHIIVSDDGKAAVWVGTIDDLWQMGKPVGQGGPWKDSEVKAGVASDPYLIGFYDKKTLKLSHKAAFDVTFTIEADPTGNGDWMSCRTVTLKAGETFRYVFPADFQARWIRFKADADTEATAWLIYE